MTVNYELEKKWKGVVLAQLTALSRNLPEGAEKTHEMHQYG
jgi:hypothetical protein